MRIIFPALLVVVAACASQPPTPEQLNRPQVEIAQPNDLFFGSGTSAPVTLDIGILNPASTAVVVRRIRVESPGMSQYTLRPETREYRLTLNPGQSTMVSLSTLAFTNITRLNATEPLTIRMTLEYESEGERRREIYHQRVFQ